MKRAVRLIISGNVQGVFFRAYVKEIADKLGVGGHVRNLENGKVEVFLEGNRKDVEKMIDACKQGPKHAKVDEIEIRDENSIGAKEFKILRI